MRQQEEEEECHPRKKERKKDPSKWMVSRFRVPRDDEEK